MYETADGALQAEAPASAADIRLILSGKFLENSTSVDGTVAYAASLPFKVQQLSVHLEPREPEYTLVCYSLSAHGHMLISVVCDQSLLCFEPEGRFMCTCAAQTWCQ